MSTITNNALSTNLTNIYNRNQSFMAKALTQTATGQRVVSAKDGPSDWAISERMLEQNRSLQQASRNVQNGNAMLKTAEGGIQNTVDILTTLKERVVNAANAHNSDDDLTIIQKEVDKLIEQVDTNVDNVKFNGKKLLGGGFTFDSSAVAAATKQADLVFSNNSSKTDSDTLEDWGFHTGSTNLPISITWKNADDSATTTTSIGSYAKSATVSSFISDANTALAADGANFSLAYFAANATDIGVTDSNGDAVAASTTANGIYAIASDAGTAGGFTISSIKVDTTEKLSLTNMNPAADAATGGDFTLQIGDEASLTITLGIPDMHFKSLAGTSSIDVTSESGRTAAFTAIDKALQTALEAGTEVGTGEQRLGYVSDNIDTQIENTENAFSTIREANMAKTVTDYMKYTVLSQAAQFMLAQNNQNASSVFTLLQP